MTNPTQEKCCHHVEILRLLGHAHTLRREEKYEEAEQSCRQALSIAEQSFGKTHRVYAHTLDDLSVMLTAQRRFPEARDAAEEAIAILERELGSESVEVLNLFTRLHDLYR